LNSISGVQWQHTKSALTPILDFSLSSEVVITWQTDSTVYKLKPRLFHKSTQLQVHLADFHPNVNCAWHRSRPATKPVVLKVYNVKLSFDIWLVLYIYFILYFWQYPSFNICNFYMKVIYIAIHKDYAVCCSYRALTVL